MNTNLNYGESAKSFTRAALRQAKFIRSGIGLAALALAFDPTSRADWSPPQSGVTPPAVVTLNVFASGLNGKVPEAPLVVGPDGALYGSTQGGGLAAFGTLFRVTPGGAFTNLHVFGGMDGSHPSAAMVVGPDGALYGVTGTGGTNGKGTVFRLETNGMFTKLHDFTNGAGPGAALVVGPDGALYGSTESGGTNIGPNAPNGGTLFRIETNGAFNLLHVFTGLDGSRPEAAMVVGPDGALYGTTYESSTVFRLETNGTFTSLHVLSGSTGALPLGGLVVGPDGGMYGVTWHDGTSGGGTLFRVDTNGNFAVMQEFTGTNGYQPLAGLVVGPDGALYGSTYAGGTNYNAVGTLFRLETNGTFTTLHSFSINSGDGYSPQTAMVVGPDGAMYGATLLGPSYGTLYRLETNGDYAKLYDFRGTNGANPSAPLVLGPDGALYGTVPDGNGAPGGGGMLFKLILNRPPVAQCHDVIVSAGADCTAAASVDNGSFDPDPGDTITLTQDPPGPYPLGTTQVTLTVTDNHGATDTCMATVTVVDTTPPAINNLAVTPKILWPPDRKLVEVTVLYTAADNCGAVSNALSVTSNEGPVRPAHGSTPDWVIVDTHHVLLRAERSGLGTGRVYTITVTSTDTAGNSSTGIVTVTVPINQIQKIGKGKSESSSRGTETPPRGP